MENETKAKKNHNEMVQGKINRLAHSNQSDSGVKKNRYII